MPPATFIDYSRFKQVAAVDSPIDIFTHSLREKALTIHDSQLTQLMAVDSPIEIFTHSFREMALTIHD